MGKTIISEGKTSSEAIEKGLKELKTSRKNVDVKILENEDKRSFFSILAPRTVKVEITVKEKNEKNEKNENNHENGENSENAEQTEIKPKKEINLSEEEQNKAKENLEKFINELKEELPEDMTYKINPNNEMINVELNSPELGYLIGYRGKTLYAMQTVMSTIAGKGIEQRVRVILDIEGYKEKREKTLKELADKMAKRVIKTRKPVKLEPMQPYERKIIHSELQNSEKVKTVSIGEEPYRRIVISLK